MTDLVDELRSGHRIGMHRRLCRAADEIERLRRALEEILEEVGTSTKANKIATAALSAIEIDANDYHGA